MTVSAQNADMPDDVKLAIIAHKYAPVGSGDRIYAQNHLLRLGLGKFVDINNGQQPRES